jgi:BlaR1 peptidase M56
MNAAAEATRHQFGKAMLHELIHVSRRDNLLGALKMLSCCLFWFRPLIWLIDHKLLAERELAQVGESWRVRIPLSLPLPSFSVEPPVCPVCGRSNVPV